MIEDTWADTKHDDDQGSRQSPKSLPNDSSAGVSAVRPTDRSVPAALDGRTTASVGGPVVSDTEALSRHFSSFQDRVQPWIQACFGPEISQDRIERNHRFLEESLELVQSLGCSRKDAYQLVDYVFSRPSGMVIQEIGGVMVTLAALCLANHADMHVCGEAELDRVWQCVEKIRAKQAAKPKHSPLPEFAEPAPSGSERSHRYSGEHSRGFWNRVAALPDDRRDVVYGLGVELQNLEERVLKALAASAKDAQPDQASANVRQDGADVGSYPSVPNGEVSGQPTFVAELKAIGRQHPDERIRRGVEWLSEQPISEADIARTHRLAAEGKLGSQPASVQTISGRIDGGEYPASGRWFVTVELHEKPACLQIGAPASVTMRTTPLTGGSGHAVSGARSAARDHRGGVPHRADDQRDVESVPMAVGKRLVGGGSGHDQGPMGTPATHAERGTRARPDHGSGDHVDRRGADVPDTVPLTGGSDEADHRREAEASTEVGPVRLQDMDAGRPANANPIHEESDAGRVASRDYREPRTSAAAGEAHDRTATADVTLSPEPVSLQTTKDDDDVGSCSDSKVPTKAPHEPPHPLSERSRR